MPSEISSVELGGAAFRNCGMLESEAERRRCCRCKWREIRTCPSTGRLVAVLGASDWHLENCRALQDSLLNIRGSMSLLTVKPTKIDERIARTVARKTNRRAEIVARGLTWGADEKILWLGGSGLDPSRAQGEPLRRAGNHALLVAATASVLPQLVEVSHRPDASGPEDGVGTCSRDPSPASAKTPFRGHALHMGALASAAGPLPAGPAGDTRAGGEPLSGRASSSWSTGRATSLRLRSWCGAGTNASLMDGLSHQRDR